MPIKFFQLLALFTSASPASTVQVVQVAMSQKF